MLCLDRKAGEEIVIGDNIRVVVRRVRGNVVSLAVSAPREVPVYRKEIYDRIQAENGKGPVGG